MAGVPGAITEDVGAADSERTDSVSPSPTPAEVEAPAKEEKKRDQRGPPGPSLPPPTLPSAPIEATCERDRMSIVSTLLNLKSLEMLAHLLESGVGKLEYIDTAYKRAVIFENGQVEKVTVCYTRH